MSADYDLLRDATKDNTPRFAFTGFLVGKVVDVYDGDTCRLAVAVGGVAQYLQIRMLGYDAPEMKLKHRPYGIEVRDVLRDLVLGRIVVAHIPVVKKPDPYGRTLGHLYVMELSAREPPEGRRVSRIRRLLACCLPPPAAPEEQVIVESVHLVRRRIVAVPPTVDIPRDFPRGTTDGLLHVNQWMLDNARVHPYDGTVRRPEYTDEELENGVENGR